MRNGAVRVDAHHHFWDPARYVYPWMEGSAMGPVRKRFSPEDVVGELAKSDIDGTVLVQTLSSLDESHELLETASHWEWVRGVVAWVDLAANDVCDQLDELRASTGGERLVGARHQVHDEEDPRWLTHRLMFGSDWPVCLLVVPSYQEVIAALEEALGDLSDDESRQAFGANAQRLYRLALPGR